MGMVGVPHQDVIDTIADVLKEASDIRALFLSGSYGTGLADEFSDIDFVLVAESGASDAVAELWHRAISRTGDIVLWWDRTTRPLLINAITADWTRTDVVILKPDQMATQSKAALKPVFDHDGIFENLTETSISQRPNPERLRHQIEEFIRIIGLLHLGIGRQEYINGFLGVSHLRNKLIELLIAETAAPNRGGVLHLNRLLTDEQQQLLIALPMPYATRDAIIAAYLAYAKAYLPRARQAAIKLGVEWPERFETATWAKLGGTLGIERPYDPY